jgi:hypothetical protein
MNQQYLFKLGRHISLLLQNLFYIGWLHKVAERLILAPGNIQTGTKRNSNLIEFVFRRMLSALPQRIFTRACHVGCVRTITEAANMGCCDAAMHLGNFYQKKYYASPMIKANTFLLLAEEYLTLAAQQGLTKAQYSLGLMLLDTPRQTEGKDWLKCAALKGHVGSQLFLGRFLEKNDRKDAVEWYTLAAKRGNFDAQFFLACMGEVNAKHSA